MRAIYLIFVCIRIRIRNIGKCVSSSFGLVISFFFAFACTPSRLSLTVSLSVHRLPACSSFSFLSFASPVLVLKVPLLIHLWVCVRVAFTDTSIVGPSHFFRSLLHYCTLSLNHCIIALFRCCCRCRHRCCFSIAIFELYT